MHIQELVTMKCYRMVPSKLVPQSPQLVDPYFQTSTATIKQRSALRDNESVKKIEENNP